MKKYSSLSAILFFLILIALKNSAAKPFGDDVLLIVNYNFPHYESIDFLKSIYNPCFPHIVFYGAKDHPDVIQLDTYRGWYAYAVILDAMQRFPEYQGYLCIHDDCVLNFWNLYRFDKYKIWADGYGRADLAKAKNAIHGWGWWPKSCGYDAVKQVYDKLPEKYIENLSHNYGDYSVCWGVF